MSTQQDRRPIGCPLVCPLCGGKVILRDFSREKGFSGHGKVWVCERQDWALSEETEAKCAQLTMELGP